MTAPIMRPNPASPHVKVTHQKNNVQELGMILTLEGGDVGVRPCPSDLVRTETVSCLRDLGLFADRDYRASKCATSLASCHMLEVPAM